MPINLVADELTRFNLPLTSSFFEAQSDFGHVRDNTRTGDALRALPRPRQLVTTPYHLNTLLESGLPLPPVDQLLLAPDAYPQPAGAASKRSCRLRANT